MLKILIGLVGIVIYEIISCGVGIISIYVLEKFIHKEANCTIKEIFKKNDFGKILSIGTDIVSGTIIVIVLLFLLGHLSLKGV